ncbi:MAG: hypothetical protein H9535_20405 [Ignavibacteria bacterium]|nr:hypothetical protein [Ignavibacteria bacterium]
MNTNHQILEAPQSAMLTTNVRRQALWQTSLIFAFALSILIALFATSCQSPLDIVTPKTSTLDITWNTAINPQTQQVEKSVSSLNGVEPQVVFTLSRDIFISTSTTTGTHTVQNGLARAQIDRGLIPGDTTSPPSIAASFNGSPFYALSRFSSNNFKKVNFLYLPALLFPSNVANQMPVISPLSDLTAQVPVQVLIPNYTLTDNKVDWLGKVEMLSPISNGDTWVKDTQLQRGQPLTVRWSSNVADADGAEITLTSRVFQDSTIVPVHIEKNVPASNLGVNEAQFTAEETKKLLAGRGELEVRYYKVKAVNDGKVVFTSESRSGSRIIIK